MARRIEQLRGCLGVTAMGYRAANTGYGSKAQGVV